MAWPSMAVLTVTSKNRTEPEMVNPCQETVRYLSVTHRSNPSMSGDGNVGLVPISVGLLSFALAKRLDDISKTG